MGYTFYPHLNCNPMGNNRKTTRGRKKQIIYSEPRKIFVEQYLAPKGEKLLLSGKITKKEAWEKYGKNRYKINPSATPIKTINHV